MTEDMHTEKAPPMIKVTEEMLQAGALLGLHDNSGRLVGEFISESEMESIYLAMRAKEAPCPDDVERTWREVSFRADKLDAALEAPRETDRIAMEAENLLDALTEYRAALSSIQGVRTSLGTDGGEL